jgi:diguanylate cyclase
LRLKQWIQKLVDQLDYDFSGHGDKSKPITKITEDRATLLYMIDTYSKHLIEVENYPIRKVRETFDGFSKELVLAEKEHAEDAMFRFRQFFASYKTAEFSYLSKTFEDFKGIVWNFVEQLAEDANNDQSTDGLLALSLKDLREAVEADSLPQLRAKSRQFIDVYMTQQSKKVERQAKRARGIKKNLDVVKKQLSDADRSMRMDHLTGAFNRKSFDEHVKQQLQIYAISKNPVSMIIMDIDFFKKVNDTYGHDVGDFILKECVKLLQNVFAHEGDFVSRIGGEEFAIILPNHAVEHALKRADDAMARIRKDVFVEKNMELRFTMSMGIAQLVDGETADLWIKRADQALYDSKHGGRNRYTVAAPHAGLQQVA